MTSYFVVYRYFYDSGTGLYSERQYWNKDHGFVEYAYATKYDKYPKLDEDDLCMQFDIADDGVTVVRKIDPVER